MAVLGEGGVVRDPVIQIEAAKPAIGQVQVHLFTEPPFRPDAEAIANQQHPDEELRIDRRTTSVAVEISEVSTDRGQIHEPVDGSKQVVLWDLILKRKLVEQRRLRLLPWSHHRQSSHPLAELNQHGALRSSASFSTE